MSLLDVVVTTGVLIGFGYVIWAQLRAKQSPIYTAVSNLIDKKKKTTQDIQDMQQQIWQSNQGRL